MRQVMRLLLASSKKKAVEKPLTFTAEQANSTVKLTKSGSPTVSGLEYRQGTSGGWSPYTIDTVITLSNVGDVVQFQNVEQTLSTSTSDYVQFVMTGLISASGNIQSMLNYIEQCKDYCYRRLFNSCSSLITAPELPSKTLANYCYHQMFQSSSLTIPPELPATTLANYCYANMFRNSNLTIPPELPATTLADYCYYCMFYYCTSLTNAPELPATTLAYHCYDNMFYWCRSLTTAPETLPATILADSCYWFMFYGCSSLTTAPELPATTLANYQYYYSSMFRSCSNLNYIKVGFKKWWNGNTDSWVSGVSSTGTFVAPPSLPQVFGTSNIPKGWVVQYDNENAIKTPTNLTSNNGDNFTVSQSVFNEGSPAWFAMDGFTDSQTICYPQTTNDFGWWKIEFNNPVKIHLIKLNLGDKTAYLQASEDGENWIQFDKGNFTANTTTNRSYGTNKYYKYYRLRATTANILYINQVSFVYEEQE